MPKLDPRVVMPALQTLEYALQDLLVRVQGITNTEEVKAELAELRQEATEVRQRLADFLAATEGD